MIFLPFVLPICLWVAWSDMAKMKIPNYAVLALAVVFILLGPFVFEWPDYFWRLGQGVVILVIGFLLNQIRLIGAGDAKFAGAMAPFISGQHIFQFLMLFALVLIVSFLGHRLAKNIKPIRNLVPNWESWNHIKFPMGLSLATALAVYLLLVTF